MVQQLFWFFYYNDLMQDNKLFASVYQYVRSNLGFSLIELMVVVAIAAIIAAVAIPNYRTYTRKARVVEMIASIDPCQTVIYQQFIRSGNFPDNVNCHGINLTSGGTLTPINGNIQVQYNLTGTDNNCARFIVSNTDLADAGGTRLQEAAVWIVSDANGDIVYGCGVPNAGANNVDDELLPLACRGTIECEI